MSERRGKIERISDGHYLTQYVDVCRNCRGKGNVPDPGPHSMPGETLTTCWVCEGTGRVVVSKEIHIKVEPYKTT